MQNIAFDSHKRYTPALVERPDGTIVHEQRIPHERGRLQEFLGKCEAGSPVAVETVGNWYWIVDEIEQAGMKAKLVHARKAKLMMGMINKTDKLDVRGMNKLQRNGVLPTVWIPEGELRDKRELIRTRMFLVHNRTRVKNRISSTMLKYALDIREVTDTFGKTGRELLEERMKELPSQTKYVTRRMLWELDSLERKIVQIEERMRKVFKKTREVRLLDTLPGVGLILATVIAHEVGDVNRFPRAENLASYAGTTPRVHASGGKVRYGRMRPDVNRYLKWAFVEAGNSVARKRERRPERHVVRLYERIAKRRGGSTAVGAVARHLAEATYWMLKKGEPYRERRVFRRTRKRGDVMSS